MYAFTVAIMLFFCQIWLFWSRRAALYQLLPSLSKGTLAGMAGDVSEAVALKNALALSQPCAVACSLLGEASGGVLNLLFWVY